MDSVKLVAECHNFIVLASLTISVSRVPASMEQRMINVLIGSTSYSESKKVISSLKDGQAKAVVSGDKYVIAWTTEDSATELMTQLRAAVIKNAKTDSITITSKWNITVTTQVTTKFDESGLKTSIALPDASKAGLKWNVNGRDAGQGSTRAASVTSPISRHTSAAKAESAPMASIRSTVSVAARMPAASPIFSIASIGVR